MTIISVLDYSVVQMGMYWRTPLLKDLKSLKTIDSALRAFAQGSKTVHDLNVTSYELAPTTFPAFWSKDYDGSKDGSKQVYNAWKWVTTSPKNHAMEIIIMGSLPALASYYPSCNLPAWSYHSWLSSFPWPVMSFGNSYTSNIPIRSSCLSFLSNFLMLRASS